MHRARPCTHTTIVSESSGRARNTRRKADLRRGVALTLGDEGQQLLVFRLHDAHQLLSQRLRARARVARVPLDAMILTINARAYSAPCVWVAMRARDPRARVWSGTFAGGRAPACGVYVGLYASADSMEMAGDCPLQAVHSEAISSSSTRAHPPTSPVFISPASLHPAEWTYLLGQCHSDEENLITPAPEIDVQPAIFSA